VLICEDVHGAEKRRKKRRERKYRGTACSAQTNSFSDIEIEWSWHALTNDCSKHDAQRFPTISGSIILGGWTELTKQVKTVAGSAGVVTLMMGGCVVVECSCLKQMEIVVVNDGRVKRDVSETSLF